MNKRIIILQITIIIIAGFAVYANSIKGEFVWDDEHLVRDNIFIKDFYNLGKVLTNDIAAGAGEEYQYFRPLQMVTYMLDYSFWKSDVRGYHLSNIIFHILAALSIFWFVLVLFEKTNLALLTSLFFIIHPIHTEAVAYISGRADSLVTIFLALTLIFYIKGINSSNRSMFIFMALSYVLCLMSRENSLMLPVFIILYHRLFKKRINFIPLIPIFILILIYLPYRSVILAEAGLHLKDNSVFLQRLPGFFAAFFSYIRLLVFSFNLHMEYGNNLFSFSQPVVISGVLALVIFFACLFAARKKSPLILFSMMWYLAALLPQSNLFPVKASMAEHWLYIPSIGFFLILAYAAIKLYEIKKLRLVSVICSVASVIYFGCLTIYHNNNWKTPLALYQWTLKHSPKSIRTLNSLAILSWQSGDPESAIGYLKRSLEVNPTYAFGCNNLGLVYAETQRFREAEIELKKAIEIYPEYAAAHNNIGMVYDKISRDNEAIKSFIRAIELNPNYVTAYVNLGNIYKKLGEYKNAIPAYRKAIELNPNSVEAYNNLAIAFALDENNEESESTFKTIIGIKPDYIDAYNNLGFLYQRWGRFRDAIDYYKKALQINPDAVTVHINISSAYLSIKEFDLALKHYDKAVSLGHKPDPEYLEKLAPHR
ncbi:MAG: tetratricopeptide repeat protein [Candidatus Omnitrophota bacterium]